MAEVFDAVEVEPRVDDGKSSGDDGEEGDGREEGMREGVLERKGIRRRRGGKRMMLATLSDDSTVVYYLVHEGLVKPRQN